MALSEVVQRQRTTGGKGGLFGKLAGLGAAVVAAPFTGGASLQAAGPLMSLGGAVGGVADPQKVKGGQRNKLDTFGKGDRDVRLAKLTEARKAAMQLPADQSDQTVPIIDETIARLRRV